MLVYRTMPEEQGVIKEDKVKVGHTSGLEEVKVWIEVGRYEANGKESGRCVVCCPGENSCQFNVSTWCIGFFVLYMNLL